MLKKRDCPVYCCSFILIKLTKIITIKYVCELYNILIIYLFFNTYHVIYLQVNRNNYIKKKILNCIKVLLFLIFYSIDNYILVS